MAKLDWDKARQEKRLRDYPETKEPPITNKQRLFILELLKRTGASRPMPKTMAGASLLIGELKLLPKKKVKK